MSDERTYIPPVAVREVCASALRTVEQYRRKGIESAVLLAKRLQRGEALTVDALQQLYEWLDDASTRAKSSLVHKLDDGGPSTTGAIYSLSGGRPALEWAREALIDAGRLAASGAASVPKHRTGQILKVDEELGIVFGWAIVSAEDGEPYFDIQGDHIPEEAMLDAAVDFMANSRQLGDMHKADEGGTVLFAFPMTAEIAKAFGLETKTTGLMIGVKPLRKATLEKFKSGEYSGFSIGGRRKVDEEVAA